MPQQDHPHLPLTTTAGAPVGDNQSSLTAGDRGTAQMLTGGVMTALTAPFMDNSVLPMIVAMSVCAYLAGAAAAISLPPLRLRPT